MISTTYHLCCWVLPINWYLLIYIIYCPNKIVKKGIYIYEIFSVGFVGILKLENNIVFNQNS